MKKGWKFPINVDAETGRILVSDDEDNIRESIIIILKTMEGERIMNKSFGSNIYKFTFEIFNATIFTLFKREIKKSIERWESRVTNIEVKADFKEENPNKINIEILYEIIKTGRNQLLEYTFDNNK